MVMGQSEEILEEVLVKQSSREVSERFRPKIVDIIEIVIDIVEIQFFFLFLFHEILHILILSMKSAL